MPRDRRTRLHRWRDLLAHGTARQPTSCLHPSGTWRTTSLSPARVDEIGAAFAFIRRPTSGIDGDRSPPVRRPTEQAAGALRRVAADPKREVRCPSRKLALGRGAQSGRGRSVTSAPSVGRSKGWATKSWSRTKPPTPTCGTAGSTTAFERPGRLFPETARGERHALNRQAIPRRSSASLRPDRPLARGRSAVAGQVARDS